MDRASTRAWVAALVAVWVTGCFEPNEPQLGGSTGEETAGSGVEASNGSGEVETTNPVPMQETESAGDTGDSGCTVDGDCVDVDTCSVDTCESGSCVHTPNVDDPDCVCMVASDCVQLPADDECRTRTCIDSVCGLDFTPAGTPLNETLQTAEDCHLVVCDGNGESESIFDDADVPVDGRECTTDVCEAGVPGNVPLEAGSKCAAGECDADGDCVGCSDPADCGGESTFCEAVTCEAQVCGVQTTDAGTVLPEQTPGDCQRVECDGEGNAASVADAEDLPSDDGNDCTEAVCDEGAGGHVYLPTNTACDDDGGTFCDGAGACVECNSNSQCGGGSACMLAVCMDHECTLVPNQGAACDDGLFCTETDTCNATGTCVGSGDPCPGADGDNDCSEGCNETANNCSGLDPAGSPCDDNLFCTQTDTCNASGSCSGSGNPCPGADGDADCTETCDEAANACSGNDPNGTDCGACRRCSSGVCNNTCNPLQQCCPDDICISAGQSCP